MLKTIKKLWKDESAQGATEYILMLVVVVGIAIAFGPKIKEIVNSKAAKVGQDIQSFE